jgi:sec-independent protein translocase protein TatB
MFGIGWSELVIIAILALVLLGPERIPQVFATFGKILRELRATSADLQDEFKRALEENHPMEPPSLPSSSPTSSSSPPPEESSARSELSEKKFGAPVRVKRSG